MAIEKEKNIISLDKLPYWYKAHQQASKEARETYADPKTGATVFTAAFHMRRGKCCGSKCRHCPYNHINVPE